MVADAQIDPNEVVPSSGLCRQTIPQQTDATYLDLNGVARLHPKTANEI